METVEEAPNHTLWKTRFGRGYGPVIRLRNDDQDKEKVTSTRTFCDETQITDNNVLTAM